jgi:hypothetical protein
MKVSGQLEASTALSLRNETPIPVGEEAGLAPESVGTLWRREKSLAPAGNRPPGRPSCSPSQYRLRSRVKMFEYVRILVAIDCIKRRSTTWIEILKHRSRTTAMKMRLRRRGLHTKKKEICHCTCL